jgi:hypothetical protein
MTDKPTEDQSVSGEVNKQAPQPPEVPSIGQVNEPTGNGAKRSQSEKAGDREGQTREPRYDEA